MRWRNLVDVLQQFQLVFGPLKELLLERIPASGWTSCSYANIALIMLKQELKEVERDGLIF